MLTALQFHHNLPVSLLDSLTVITLARAAEFERFMPFLLRLLPFLQLLLVVTLHCRGAM